MKLILVVAKGGPMHILMTVNAAWNIWSFRRPVVEALLGDGHRLTVHAPADEAVPELEGLGCRVRPLEMSVKGLNPLEDIKLLSRFKRVFQDERPDVVLSYTIKNNIFGARAARALRVPFLPNVTGLGTAFLSGKLLQTVTEQLYRRSLSALPTVFFQNEDDRDLFLDRTMVREDQARLLPGSGIDLIRFAPAAMPPAEGAPRTLIEAAAMARPVITTDVSGCRAVVDRDVSGFFCEVRSAENLAATVERFLALPPAAQQAMGQAGRAKMKQGYDQAIVVDAYREAIERLVKLRQGR